MPKYNIFRLINSKWSEPELIVAKNRKTVKNLISDKYELSERQYKNGGIFKIRKVSD